LFELLSPIAKGVGFNACVEGDLVDRSIWESRTSFEKSHHWPGPIRGLDVIDVLSRNSTIKTGTN
jgi:hypothetical protein